MCLVALQSTQYSLTSPTMLAVVHGSGRGPATRPLAKTMTDSQANRIRDDVSLALHEQPVKGAHRRIGLLGTAATRHSPSWRPAMMRLEIQPVTHPIIM